MFEGDDSGLPTLTILTKEKPLVPNEKDENGVYEGK